MTDARPALGVGRWLRRSAFVVTLTMFVGACATPVGVQLRGPRQVYREVATNALSADEPSADSRRVLQRLGLSAAFDDDPAAVLVTLHEGLRPSGDEDRLFALAELSFEYAHDAGLPAYYLAAATYAYALLFPETGAGVTLDPSDPRLRLTYEIYNRGLTEALLDAASTEVVLRAGERPLPFGRLTLATPPAGFSWAGYRLDHFVPAARLAVRGLRNRYRRAGIGAPLTAQLVDDAAAKTTPGYKWIPPRTQVPVTAFLRIDRPRQALAAGAVDGALELYSLDDGLNVTVDGRAHPLEFETSSSLASTLADASLWDFELRGFFSGSLHLLDFLGDRSKDGLLMMHPYRPGKIPVVLVHGTASSPGRWADLVNEIENDPRLWSRYQVWLFIYNTGNPIPYSGSLLRQALTHAVSELDPQGADPALQQMVVIGHSQGGLLTTLTAVESGDRFYNALTKVPFDQLKVNDDTRALLRRTLFFSPLPFVKQVVFICTPHRGSFLATWNIVRRLAGLIELPADVVRDGVAFMTSNRDALLVHSVDRMPTSLDNMHPKNWFLRNLADLPLAPWITGHSIIAVKGTGPFEDGDDSVVAYHSAHRDGLASELVVRSGHSAQSEPRAIEEVRRILLEHAGLQ